MSKRVAADSTVTSFAELHARLSTYDKDWIFRGQADARWELLPKAGRRPYKTHEYALFESWKRRAAEHLAPRHHSEWDLIAIAQHHGLATRLLDWTTNPLNAAYFSVREHTRTSGPAVIHAAKFVKAFSKSAETARSNPLEFDEIGIFRPRGVVPRIVRQGGLFTVHGPPDLSLERLTRDHTTKIVALERIVIDQSYRPKLLAELARYGIHAAALFPDLDGISTYLDWSAERGVFLD